MPWSVQDCLPDLARVAASVLPRPPILWFIQEGSVISAALAFAAAALGVAGSASILKSRPQRSRDGFARRLAGAVPARLRPPLDPPRGLRRGARPAAARPGCTPGSRRLARPPDAERVHGDQGP